MKKSIRPKSEQRQERLELILKLQNEIKVKTKELDELLGIAEEEVTPLPEGVLMTQAILGVFEENTKKSLNVSDIVEGIKKKFDSVQDISKVRQTTRYLVKRGDLENPKYGIFKKKQVLHSITDVVE